MIIDLHDLTEGFTNLDFEESAEDIYIVEENLRFSSPVKTHLSFYKLGESLSVQGHCSVSLGIDCVRCLESTTHSLEAGFKFVFQKGRPDNVTDGDDDSLIWLDDRGDKLDLGQDIKDYILLEIPQSPVCSESCNGICPTCGENLNTNPCSCKEESIDPRWEALRAIKE